MPADVELRVQDAGELWVPALPLRGEAFRASGWRRRYALERSLPEGPLTGAATFVLANQLIWSGELEQARAAASNTSATP